MLPLLALAPAALSFLGGAAQSIFSGAKRKERALEAFNANAPKYTQNPSILDYYNKALARYNPNAFQSAAYQQGQQNIGSNLASGISATQDRRAGLAGVSNLVGQSNRASLQNVANAEQQQGQALGQLGNAAKAQTGEDRMAFNINQQQPFERGYNLLAMKAAQAAKTKNQGFQNMYNGLSNATSIFGGMRSGGGIGQANPTINTGPSMYDFLGPDNQSNNQTV